MTNEIEKRGQSIPVNNYSDLEKMAFRIEKSKIMGCKQAGDGMVILSSCLQTGMSLLEFTSKYAIVDGKPAMWSDNMLTNFRDRGGKHKVLKRDSEEAKVELEKDGVTTTFAFTWQEAKKEKFPYAHNGKYKDNWSTPRGRMQMLWHRVVSDAVKTIDPGALQESRQTVEVMEDSVDTAPEPEAPKPMKSANAEPEPEQKSEPIDPEVVKPEESEKIDYSVIPVGPKKGTPWKDIPLDKLEASLTSEHPSITDGHREEIKKAVKVLKAKKTKAENKKKEGAKKNDKSE